MLKEETLLELLKEVGALFDFSRKFDISPLLTVLINCPQSKKRDLLIEKVVKICRLESENLSKLVQNVIYSPENRLILGACMEFKPFLVNKYVVDYLNDSSFSQKEKDALLEQLSGKLLVFESQGKNLNLVIGLNSHSTVEFRAALDKTAELLENKKTQVLNIAASAAQLRLSAVQLDSEVQILLNHPVFPKLFADSALLKFVSDSLWKGEFAWLCDLTLLLVEAVISATKTISLELAIWMVSNVDPSVLSKNNLFSFLKEDKVASLGEWIASSHADNFFAKLGKLPLSIQEALSLSNAVLKATKHKTQDWNNTVLRYLSILLDKLGSDVLKSIHLNEVLDSVENLALREKKALVSLMKKAFSLDKSLFQQLIDPYFSKYSTELNSIFISATNQVPEPVRAFSFMNVCQLINQNSVTALKTAQSILKNIKPHLFPFDSLYFQRKGMILFDTQFHEQLIQTVEALLKNSAEIQINSGFTAYTPLLAVKYSQTFFKRLIEGALSEVYVSPEAVECLKFFETKQFDSVNFNEVDQRLVQRMIDQLPKMNLSSTEEALFFNLFECIFSLIMNNKYKFKEIAPLAEKLLKCLSGNNQGKYRSLTSLIGSFLLESRKNIDLSLVEAVFAAYSKNDCSLAELASLQFDKANLVATTKKRLENDFHSAFLSNATLIIQSIKIEKTATTLVSGIFDVISTVFDKAEDLSEHIRDLNLLFSKVLELAEFTKTKVPTKSVITAIECIIDHIKQCYRENLVSSGHSLTLLLDILTAVSFEEEQFQATIEGLLSTVASSTLDNASKTRLLAVILSSFRKYVGRCKKTSDKLLVSLVKLTVSSVTEDSLVLRDLTANMLAVMPEDKQQLYFLHLLVFQGRQEDTVLIDIMLNTTENIEKVFSILPEILGEVKKREFITEEESKHALFSLVKVVDKYNRIHWKDSQTVDKHLFVGVLEELAVLTGMEGVNEVAEVLLDGLWSLFLQKDIVLSEWESVDELSNEGKQVYFTRMNETFGSIKFSRDIATRVVEYACNTISQRHATKQKLKLAVNLVNLAEGVEVEEEQLRELLEISDKETKMTGFTLFNRVIAKAPFDHIELFESFVESLLSFGSDRFTTDVLTELEILTGAAAEHLADNLGTLVQFLVKSSLKDRESSRICLFNLAKGQVCADFLKAIHLNIKGESREQAVLLLESLNLNFSTNLDSTQVEAENKTITSFLISAIKEHFIGEKHTCIKELISSFVFKMSSKQLKAILKDTVKKCFAKDIESGFEDTFAGVVILTEMATAAKKYFLMNYSIVANALSNALKAVVEVFTVKGEGNKKPRALASPHFKKGNYLKLLREGLDFVRAVFSAAEKSDSLTPDYFEELGDRLVESVLL